MTPAALAAIHAACFTVPRPWSGAEIAGLVAAPGAVLAQHPQGFALARVAAGEGELLTIAVRPEARGRGIGAALLSEILAGAAARGAERIFLEVAADNAAALALYQRGGFAVCGRRKGYYVAPDGHRIDALILARPVDAATREKS